MMIVSGDLQLWLLFLPSLVILAMFPIIVVSRKAHDLKKTLDKAKNELFPEKKIKKTKKKLPLLMSKEERRLFLVLQRVVENLQTHFPKKLYLFPQLIYHDSIRAGTDFLLVDADMFVLLTISKRYPQEENESEEKLGRFSVLIKKEYEPYDIDALTSLITQKINI